MALAMPTAAATMMMAMSITTTNNMKFITMNVYLVTEF